MSLTIHATPSIELQALKYSYLLKHNKLENTALPPLFIRVSPDGLYTYVAFAMGIFKKFDNLNKNVVNEIKLVDEVNDFAISNNGDYIAIVTTNNKILFLNTETFLIVADIDTQSENSIKNNAISVVNAAPRFSFIFTFKNKKELWEMPYSDEGGVEVFQGWAHDYRKDSGEGKVEKWKLSFSEKSAPPFRRIITPDYLEHVFFDQHYINVISRLQNSDTGIVMNLDAKRKVTNIKTNLLINPLSFTHQKSAVFISSATSCGDETNNNKLNVVDIESGNVVKTVALPAQISFYTTHVNSPTIWLVLKSNDENKHLIWLDKLTLSVVKSIPITVKNTIKDIVFSRLGNFILLAFEDDITPIIYDNETFTPQLINNE